MNNNIQWILVPVRNGIEFTRPAMKTFLAQDVPGTVRVMVIDNGSTDGTGEWLRSLYPKVVVINNGKANSVAESWNIGLSALFGDAEAVLVCNNDVMLRPDTYGVLLAHGGGFVTAVGNNDPECINHPIEAELSSRPHPDFSCYLIREWVWKKVGKFDEGFKGAFCEDWDYHCRMHKAGVEAVCVDIPFYHVGSATVNNCPAEIAEEICLQADRNREYFAKKWGFKGGTKEYEDFFTSS